MSRTTRAIIDLSALSNNIQQLKNIAISQYAPKFMAIIKADGYGHGIVRVATHLNEADSFGVICIDQAIQLREAGVKQNIVLLAGFLNKDEYAETQRYQLQPVIHNEKQLQILLKQPAKLPFTLWLKFNTGMNRLGFPCSAAVNVYQRVLTCPWVTKPIGVMTHLSDADDLKKTKTKDQLTKFTDLQNSLIEEGWNNFVVSITNSAGLLAWPEARQGYLRAGLSLYGVSPFADKLGTDFNLQPVMQLQSKLIAIQKCYRGDLIGYGGEWQCPEDMTMGVVAIGYADGYPRSAVNGTPTLINGKIAPLVGRVSMDLLTVDLRQHPQAQIGDPVVLWGKGLPVETIARHANMIPHELLTEVLPRVCRVETI